jgi:Transglycosylase SLT domain
MVGRRLLFAAFLALVPLGGLRAEVGAPEPASVATPAGDGIVIAAIAPRPRSLPPASPERRCTDDLAYCITLTNYVPDVCRTIEAVARDASLDPGFFARLIWKESLFDAAAVSPKGAQGIAQFIPATAQRRGLKDAFNPAEALLASARYLAELSRDYGNVGLAAAAYNGGEGRVARFLAQDGGLPAETRAYVEAITGHSAETWRDAPPRTVDLALAADASFQTACIAQAANRAIREFKTGPTVLPWGVVVASNRDRDGAARQVARLTNRYAAVLRGESITYTRNRRPGMPRTLTFAQVGRDSRASADALCARLQAAGADCMVLRN